MINRIKRKINYLIDYVRNDVRNEQILMNQGKILSSLNHGKEFGKLSDYEWKVFSQWGEEWTLELSES